MQEIEKMATPESIYDLPTPCFLVDKDRLQNNLNRMIDICKDLNVSLRPNTKTHRTIEIAVMATGGTKRCIEVATMLEAERYAEAGFDDILYAYPITHDKMDRCIKLMSKLSQFHVMVSDLSGVECLKANMDRLPAGKTWSVALDLDFGYARTGFIANTEDFRTAYREILNSSMRLLSLYCHCGQIYSTTTQGDRMRKQHEMVDAMNRCKHSIIGEFPHADFVVGIGSTPTCSQPLEIHKSVGEFHPGSYAFNDYELYLVNACRQKDIACRVMTRVVAHKEDRSMLIVDCGHRALGSSLAIKERPTDFCLIEGESNLMMVHMSQELGKIKAREGELDLKKYPVGSILFIHPYECNQTASLYPVYHVHSGDKVKDVWRPFKGWYDFRGDRTHSRQVNRQPTCRL